MSIDRVPEATNNSKEIDDLIDLSNGLINLSVAETPLGEVLSKFICFGLFELMI